MDFLILSPPVSMPAEPPSGAFALAAGLAGRGCDVGLLDLSLELFSRLMDDPTIANSAPRAALDYLQSEADGYEPMHHRSHTGVLHRRLGAFAHRYPGWKLSLMDIRAPVQDRDPLAIAHWIENNENPFEELFEEVLVPALELNKPKKVLVSLAYLSQLAGAIALVGFLGRRGLEPVVGGSLPTSLARTGQGIGLLRQTLGQVVEGDGLSLLPKADGHMLDELDWPLLISGKPYFSSRPVFPLALTMGCFWRRCLFCPDSVAPFVKVPSRAVERLLTRMPSHLRDRHPLVHLIDSAVPRGGLVRFAALAKEAGVGGFFGFARPTDDLLKDDLIEKAAENGLLMLQLGAESGSERLLRRFQKGLDPRTTVRVLRRATRAGIRTYLYLLFGLPGETEEDRLATLNLVVDNADCIDFLNLSLFNLPRQTALLDRETDLGITVHDFPADNSIRLYSPFECHGDDPRAEARRFLKTRFETEPVIRKILLRTPRWLRATHMALMKLSGRRQSVGVTDA